ncbi:MAG TPA: hypothetical protein VEL28_06575, partial [Candidatus Binatia bacterium]|nr:hypothetical protein [Candidatus Binatia bacterium]
MKVSLSTSALLFLAASAPAQSSGALPANVDSGLRRVLAIEQRREALSQYGPVPRAAGEALETERALQTESFATDSEGRILVRVWATASPDEVMERLAWLGGTEHARSEQVPLLEVWLAEAAIIEASRIPGLLSITASYPGRTRSGLVQTQGDDVVQGPAARAQGVDGNGFLIGVISDSALDVQNSQATSDLPANVDRYLEFPATDEGRAMLEIVH